MRISLRRRSHCAALALLLSAFPLSVVAEDEVVLAAPGSSDEGSAQRSWKLGERIPVECLNRTIDYGEHVTDAQGLLQYVPFPACAETGRPLELEFGSEADIACTISELTDALFHQFEFYIHDDAPLSCRLPSVPAASGPARRDGGDGRLVGGKEPAGEYTRMQIALTGTLQLSHLHINPGLNVVVHTTAGPEDQKRQKNAPVAEGRLLAAAAYSLPPTAHSPRIVIGDPLPLRLSVRWFSERTLPPSTARVAGLKGAGLGGHVHLSTVVYCLLSFGGGVAVSLAYWRGVELPRRMRRYGAERLGFGNGSDYRPGYAFPGKRD